MLYVLERDQSSDGDSAPDVYFVEIVQLYNIVSRCL